MSKSLPTVFLVIAKIAVNGTSGSQSQMMLLGETFTITDFSAR